MVHAGPAFVAASGRVPARGRASIANPPIPSEIPMSKALSARGLGAVLTAAVLAGLSFAAQAQVNKCAQPDGTVSYQATPCASDAPPSARVTAAQLNAAQRAQDRARARVAAGASASGARSHPRAALPSKPAAAPRCRATPASSAPNCR